MRKLAIVDKEKIDYKLEELKKIEDQKYPFKPSLNKVSQALAKKKDLDELVDDSEREKRLIRKKILAESERMKECSFKPKLNKNKRYSNVQSHYSKKNYEKKMDEYLAKKKLEVNLSAKH